MKPINQPLKDSNHRQLSYPLSIINQLYNPLIKQQKHQKTSRPQPNQPQPFSQHQATGAAAIDRMEAAGAATSAGMKMVSLAKLSNVKQQ